MQPHGHPVPTSRDTVFQAPRSPDKRRMSVNDMLQIAWRLGEGESIRNVAESSPWSPSSVHRVRERVLTDKGTEEKCPFTRGFVAHFVAFSLFENASASGRSMFEAATTVGLKTSVATINRIAAEMAFKAVFTQKQEKLTPVQKAYRVKFCREVQMWEGYLPSWVFSDETMLVLNPVKQKIRVVRGVDVEANFSEVRGYPQQVMVWGGRLVIALRALS